MSTSLIRCATAAALVATCDGYMPSAAPSRAAAVRPAAASVFMDETVFERALAGELEEEGFENPFMSEVGWADYLDKNAKSSYNMNQRPSLADDGYYTASIVDNPLDGARRAALPTPPPPSICLSAPPPRSRPPQPLLPTSPAPPPPPDAAVLAAGPALRGTLRRPRSPAPHPSATATLRPPLFPRSGERLARRDERLRDQPRRHRLSHHLQRPDRRPLLPQGLQRGAAAPHSWASPGSPRSARAEPACATRSRDGEGGRGGGGQWRRGGLRAVRGEVRRGVRTRVLVARRGERQRERRTASCVLTHARPRPCR